MMSTIGGISARPVSRQTSRQSPPSSPRGIAGAAAGRSQATTIRYIM